MNLNPRQFFHGTSSPKFGFKTVLPSAVTGRSNYDYDMDFADAEDRKRSVFMFSSPSQYDVYERDDDPPTSPHKAESDAWYWASGGGRPRVLRVQPIGTVDTDEFADAMAPKANVLDEIWIPPIRQGSGGKLGPGEGHVQGTLPNQDWQPHLKPDPYAGRRVEANWQVVNYAEERQRAKDEQVTANRLAGQRKAKANKPMAGQQQLFDPGERVKPARLGRAKAQKKTSDPVEQDALRRRIQREVAERTAAQRYRP